AYITVDGPFLSVPPGQTISLVGGNGTFIRDDTGEMVASGVTITGGFLQAPSGRINLVSVASPLISTTSPAEVLLSNYQVTPTNISNTNVGTVSLLGGTFLDVSGDPGGTVLIRGGQLVMDSSIIFSATIDTDSLPAVDINVTGDILLSNFSIIDSESFGFGRGGDINISARNVQVKDGSFIETHTIGMGPAGDLTVRASDAITVTGSDGFGNFSNISSVAEPGVDSGNVHLIAASITLDEGGQVRTQAGGAHAGDITLEASGDVDVLHGSLIEIDASGGGTSGTISITGAHSVTISGHLDTFTPAIIRNF